MNWLFQFRLRLPSRADAPRQRLRPDAHVFHLIEHTASFRTRNESRHIATQHRCGASVRQTTLSDTVAVPEVHPRSVVPPARSCARPVIQTGSSSRNACGRWRFAMALTRQRPPSVCGEDGVMASRIGFVTPPGAMTCEWISGAPIDNPIVRAAIDVSARVLTTGGLHGRRRRSCETHGSQDWRRTRFGIVNDDTRPLEALDGSRGADTSLINQARDGRRRRDHRSR